MPQPARARPPTRGLGCRRAGAAVSSVAWGARVLVAGTAAQRTACPGSRLGILGTVLRLLPERYMTEASRDCAIEICQIVWHANKPQIQRLLYRIAIIPHLLSRMCTFVSYITRITTSFTASSHGPVHQRAPRAAEGCLRSPYQGRRPGQRPAQGACSVRLDSRSLRSLLRAAPASQTAATCSFGHPRRWRSTSRKT